jgi:1,4-dihydroxy-6-naphthoate synthase
VLADEADAGVMIHEELLYFPEKGLRLVCNLGHAWQDDTGLPLPVGLNIARKSLGRALAVAVQRTCRDSLDWALAHQAEVMQYVSRFGRGCADAFVPMFSNDDTRHMPPDVREGLSVLLERVADLGLGPRLRSWEVIDG